MISYRIHLTVSAVFIFLYYGMTGILFIERNIILTAHSSPILFGFVAEILIYLNFSEKYYKISQKNY
jgi:hypothetical protein